MDAKDLEALPAYRYDRVPKGHCRIAHLHPGLREDELYITIQTLKPGIRDFVAVSYVWGNNDRVHKIYAASLTDDADLSARNISPAGHIMVTENLRKVLTSLRDEKSSRPLWIDSLCINQEDMVEKSEQGSSMRDIFGLANLTIAHLGEHDIGMDAALVIIEHLASMKDRSDEELHSVLIGSLMLPMPFQSSPRLEQAYGQSLKTAWDVFAAFLMLPWFHRVWIIQEAVLSENIIIFTDNSGLEWKSLIDACNVITRARLQFESQVSNVLMLETSRTSTRAAIAEFMRNPLDEDSPCVRNMSIANYFIKLQMRSRGCGATDPRDQVFALIGIAKGHGGWLPTVDYSMTLAEVYTRSVWAWYKVQEKNPIRFLSCVNGSYDADDLPTWVPDWRRPWNIEPIGISVDLWSPDSSSCKHLRCITFPDMGPPRLTMPLRLRVRGIRLLTIEHVEDIKAPSTWRDLRHSQLINRFPEPYPTTCMTYKDAFASVIECSKGSALTRSGSESFWSHQQRKDLHTRLRPLFSKDAIDFRGTEFPFVAKYHNGPGSAPSIYVKTSQSVRGPNEPRYTQAQLYETIHMSLRLEGSIVEDGYARSRVWFITKDGFMGLTIFCAEPGDVVVHMFGANTPHVLRKKRVDEGRTVWGYVGEAYVLGLMHGEAEHDLPEDQIEDFEME